jgi:hypothetical protein
MVWRHLLPGSESSSGREDFFACPSSRDTDDAARPGNAGEAAGGGGTTKQADDTVRRASWDTGDVARSREQATLVSSCRGELPNTASSGRGTGVGGDEHYVGRRLPDLWRCRSTHNGGSERGESVVRQLRACARKPGVPALPSATGERCSFPARDRAYLAN